MWPLTRYKISFILNHRRLYDPGALSIWAGSLTARFRKCLDPQVVAKYEEGYQISRQAPKGRIYKAQRYVKNKKQSSAKQTYEANQAHMPEWP